jgi:O-antigen ligase
MTIVKKFEAPAASKISWSQIWAYCFAVAIALLAGVVLDIYGVSLALVFVVAVSLILLSIRNFRVVCSISILALPLIPTFLIPKQEAGLSGPRLMTGLLMFAACCIFSSCALRPKQIKFPKFPAILVLYLAVLFFGAFNGARFFPETPSYFQALGVVKDGNPVSYLVSSLAIPLLTVGTAIIAGVLSANTSDSRWIVLPALCAAMVIALIVYFFAFKNGSALPDMGREDARSYLSGSGQHANELGLTLNMGLALTVSLFVMARTWWLKIVLAFCGLILLGAVFLTFSRGGYLGSATIFIYFLITQKGKKWLRLGIIACLALGFFIVPDSVVERSSYQGANKDLDEVSAGRVDEIWRPLIPSILESPVIGRGHGSILWSEAAKNHRILPVGHPHSAYLAALLDVGIVGAIVVLAFLAHVWRTFLKLSNLTKSNNLAAFYFGASVCVPVLLVQGVTDDTFMPGYTHCFLWIAYGAALGTLVRINSSQGVRRSIWPTRAIENTEE